MHVVNNLLTFKAKIENLNTLLQNKAVKALENELFLPVFVPLMVNNLLKDIEYHLDETQFILRFCDDNGEFVMNHCLKLK